MKGWIMGKFFQMLLSALVRYIEKNPDRVAALIEEGLAALIRHLKNPPAPPAAGA